MASITPFKALRPVPASAAQVASRPYDVLNSTEARHEASGNPDSFLHITKSEIDLPEDIDTHSTQAYGKAKENLQEVIRKGVLLQAEKPLYYVSRLIRSGRSQAGVVGGSAVDDY